MLALGMQWLHLLGAIMWIGPQLFLLAVLVPVLRTTPDPELRRRFTKSMAERLNVFASAGMGMVVLTGLYNAWTRLPALEALLTTRYGILLVLKVVLVVLTILLTLWHSYGLGPRLLSLPLNHGDPSLEERRLRRLSILVSSANLLLALGILLVAAMLRLGL